MKIFDGVTVNPSSLSPFWQGLLGVAMLFSGVLAEADKERLRRAAQAKDQATTLEEVMEQSGLDIPRLEEALVKFMGGSPEAKEAAAFIARAPDPVKLLRKFAHEFTAASPDGGPIVTPPPAQAEATSIAPTHPAPAAAPATARPKPAQFRPEFTREGMEAAANAAPRPRPTLARFRPEFTREGMDAAKTAAPAATPPSATAAAAPAGNTNPPSAAPVSAGSATPIPSLADALARRLAARDRRIEAHQAELETRVRCVEAELALLREEVQDLQQSKECPVVFLVPRAEPPPSPTSAEHPPSPTLMDAELPPTAPATTTDAVTTAVETDADAAETEVTPAAPVEVADAAVEVPAAPVTVATANESTSSSEERVDQGASGPEAEVSVTAETARPVPDDKSVSSESVDRDGPPAADEEALPPPISEADLARAVELLDESAERTEAHYMQQIEQVKGIQGEVKLLRALVARELVTRRAASHG